MNCQEILDKRLVILSGKGGVGKSIISALLAWMASQQGKKTLLVELDTVPTLPKIFGQSPSEGYVEQEIHPDIFCLHIDGKSGLEEYLRMVLKSKKLAEKIFQSSLYQYFVNVAPGLKELMSVGKLWEIEQRSLPGKKTPLYDLIIVDTPATGHTLSYLRMPMTATDTARKGFVNKEAQKVVDLLQDPDRTSFNIVTTPAEMPVNESIEMYQTITSELHIPFGCIFVNRVYPAFFQGADYEEYQRWKASVPAATSGESDVGPNSWEQEERALLTCTESWKNRRHTQTVHLNRLQAALDCVTVELPFLPESESPLTLIQKMAQTLA